MRNHIRYVTCEARSRVWQGREAHHVATGGRGRGKRRTRNELHTLVFSESFRCCRALEYRTSEMKFCAAIAGTCDSLKLSI